MASLRGQAQAYAKRAGGVFLSAHEFERLTTRLADVTERLRDAELQLEQIATVQGYYEVPAARTTESVLGRRTRSCPDMAELLRLP